ISYTGGTPVAGRLRHFNVDGTPKVLLINGSTDSQFSITVPANGSARFTTPNSGSSIITGWAAFESIPRLEGVATFECRSAGTLVTAAGVMGTSGARRYILPVDLSGATASTGLAIANVQSNVSLVVQLRLYDELGAEVANVIDSRLNPLGPQQHVSGF